MKHISTLYRDIAQFQSFLKDNKVNCQKPCIARVATSNLSRTEVKELTEEMKRLLPNVQIIGMTSSHAVIHNSKIEEGQTMISLEFYDNLHLSRNYFTYKNKYYKDVATEIHSVHTMSSNTKSTVHILINSGFLYISEMLAELNSYSRPLQLAGAVVGVLPQDDLGFVFDEDGIYDDVITTFSLYGESERHYLTTNVSFEVIETELQEITAIDHDRIMAVDGKDAKEWLFHYLGVTNPHFEVSDQLLTHFPIVMEDGSSSRFLHYDPETEGVYIHHETSLPQGTKFRKGCISPNYTLDNTHKSLLTMLDTPIETMFVCACLFRKIYLSNCIDWELKPFRKFNICGMFAMGEIVFANGKNLLHHGATIFSGVAEYEKYIVPDMDELLHTELIDDAIANLRHLVQQAIPDKADDFAVNHIEKVSNQEHSEFYLEMHLDIPNMIKYKIDKQTQSFRKVCLIDVESADAIIAFMGIDLYYDVCRETIWKIKKAIDAQCKHQIFSYCFNYKTFFFTCSDDVADDDFIAMCKTIHEKFEHTSSSKSEATIVLRFVIMSQTKDLIEDGIKFLFENRENTETFLVSKTHSESKNSDIHMANVIKWALDNDKIIPYYQGLYNNRTKEIDKYESLMRIEDVEGTVYTPFHFLDIAKKYNLYNKISIKMIQRVLAEFAHRTEKVAINLSLSDAQSEYFKDWFLGQLERYPHPEKITIEILESDDFKDNKSFKNFLEDVRSYGCKIAVDDFGTGYSTFVTVSTMEPDYIKIDGSIIKNIATDQKCVALLDAMSYFSEKMNALTVAEFVEDGEIQAALLEYNIAYSQGYHFSKPSPIEGLQ